MSMISMDETFGDVLRTQMPTLHGYNIWFVLWIPNMDALQLFCLREFFFELEKTE